MKIIALTGGIASGKSSVTLILRARGYVVLDADDIVRQLYGKGMPIFNAILSVFGNNILDDAGEIDRKKLGNLVFSDSEARIRLDSVTHPIVEAEISRGIEEQRMQGENIIFVDSPLLIETGKYERYDMVILVYVDPDTQIQRLRSRNQLSYEEAIQRIKSQMPLEEKKAYADYIIDNSGTLEALEQQVDLLLRLLAQSDLPIP
ncbi:MAG: dephospho-CoA kinase [Acidaminobacter sp.]|uniref:dephospho-CoA kinase n=1 Tax=Acidaminobacter sp. TaxID=1872102 RepID=UPI001384848B|nr:dephospho-CoA kinase [Acidaminobacter sp.]MZQ99369.1 dephospho-CoA kinase [Acidaminobacter sp.]